MPCCDRLAVCHPRMSSCRDRVSILVAASSQLKHGVSRWSAGNSAMSLRRDLADCTLFTMCHSPFSRAESSLKSLRLTLGLEATVKRLMQLLSCQNTVTD